MPVGLASQNRSLNKESYSGNIPLPQNRTITDINSLCHAWEQEAMKHGWVHNEYPLSASPTEASDTVLPIKKLHLSWESQNSGNITVWHWRDTTENPSHLPPQIPSICQSLSKQGQQQPPPTNSVPILKQLDACFPNSTNSRIGKPSSGRKSHCFVAGFSTGNTIQAAAVNWGSLAWVAEKIWLGGLGQEPEEMEDPDKTQPGRSTLDVSSPGSLLQRCYEKKS